MNKKSTQNYITNPTQTDTEMCQNTEPEKQNVFLFMRKRGYVACLL